MKSNDCIDLWIAVIVLAVKDYAFNTREKYDADDKSNIVAMESARLFLFSDHGAWAEWRKNVMDLAWVETTYVRRLAEKLRAQVEERRIGSG